MVTNQFYLPVKLSKYLYGVFDGLLDVAGLRLPGPQAQDRHLVAVGQVDEGSERI